MNITMPRLLAASAAIIAITITSVSLADNESHLAVADYHEFEQVNDPQISPDGSEVIYTRRWVDQQKDRWASSLWIMDADGSRHRFLQDGSNARWSPSGDRILFIANGDDDKPQIFVRWMNDRRFA